MQDSFNNPAEQVKRHVQLVKKLTNEIPVMGLVVIANPQTTIGTVPGDIPVLHMSGLSSTELLFARPANYGTSMPMNMPWPIIVC
jgi:hypothetical protein